MNLSSLISPGPLTLSSASLLLTTGGTAQSILAASFTNRYFRVANPSYDQSGTPQADSVWVNFVNGTAAQWDKDSVELLPGQFMEWPTGLIEAVSVWAPVAGHVIAAIKG